MCLAPSVLNHPDRNRAAESAESTDKQIRAGLIKVKASTLRRVNFSHEKLSLNPVADLEDDLADVLALLHVSEGVENGWRVEHPVDSDWLEGALVEAFHDKFQ